MTDRTDPKPILDRDSFLPFFRPDVGDAEIDAVQRDLGVVFPPVFRRIHRAGGRAFPAKSHLFPCVSVEQSQLVQACSDSAL